MKQRIPLSLLLFLLSSLAFAQKNYKAGFVVTTAGDTLHGSIDYKEWDMTPRTISFRASSGSGAAQEFTPGNAAYFEITGMEAYRSYEGQITMDQVDKDNLSYGRADTSVTTDKVFLRRLQNGPVADLYSYKDNIKERFFLAEKGAGRPQELLYKRYLLATNNAKVMTQRFYIGQLLNAARHQGLLTDELQREVEAAAYKEQDLLRVVSKLNGLSNEEVALNKGSRIGSRFFAGTALSRGTMEIYDLNHFANADKSSPSYMPRLAFGLDAFLNRNVQQLLLRLEGGLTNASYHFQKTEQIGGSSYDELTYNVTQQTASLSPQIIYNLYNKESLKLYVGGGLAFNYSNYSKNHYRRQHFSSSTDNTGRVYDRDPYRTLLPVWSTYTVRAGVVLNRKYEISAMYLAPGTITRYTSSEVATGSMNVGVNYLFRNK